MIRILISIAFVFSFWGANAQVTIGCKKSFDCDSVYSCIKADTAAWATRLIDLDINEFADTLRVFKLTFNDTITYDTLRLLDAYDWLKTDGSAVNVKDSIYTNGLVGIGTNSPQTELHLSDSTSTRLRLSDECTTDTCADVGIEFYRGNNDKQLGYLGYNSTDPDFYVTNNITGGDVVIETDGLELWRFNANGTIIADITPFFTPNSVLGYDTVSDSIGYTSWGSIMDGFILERSYTDDTAAAGVLSSGQSYWNTTNNQIQIVP